MAVIVGTQMTRKLIDMPRALRVVEDFFRARAEGRAQGLPRRRLRGTGRQLNMMAAFHAGWQQFCLRAYVGGANTITLYNGRTGALQAILNASYLSSLRTGAASGVAAKYLAPQPPDTLGIIGTGKQAVFQLQALTQACRPKQILIYGRNARRRRLFTRTMGKELGLDLRACASLTEIEAESDVLALATDSSTPILAWNNTLKDEVLVITIGANQAIKHEVAPDLIAHMDLVVTDTVDAARTDSGDLIEACRAGLLKWEDVLPLEQIVAHGAGAKRPKRILFQSNGIADEDLAVGHYVLEQIQRKKLKAREISEI
jgi:ornithine cyclodeaminase/alanine dehydrogenase-like protein (mu-crystallin family)